MAAVYAESRVSPAGRRGPVTLVQRMMGHVTEPELSPRTAADAPSPPTEAQREYDADPALRRAAASPTIRSARWRGADRTTE